MSNTIEVNWIKYVKADSVSQQKAPNLDDMEYVIVRTYSAGVFAWYLESEKGKEVVLRNARRLWRWSWAASLSQLAMEWVKKPQQCKFPCEVSKVKLKEAIEIIDVTVEAFNSIKSVTIWEAK